MRWLDVRLAVISAAVTRKNPADLECSGGKLAHKAQDTIHGVTSDDTAHHLSVLRGDLKNRWALSLRPGLTAAAPLIYDRSEWSGIR